ncbi:MAG: spermidine/putrescine ABC transporter substrate-binding protein [Candidatus Planktophila sp.]|nr:spermidine/putrescine ABC transporter substrate-binding protein [Candidatus Planktophila sp.]PHX76168.1 MAG: polyamine ABC transporter substrate-binding protein [Actinomycetota bacterium]
MAKEQSLSAEAQSILKSGISRRAVLAGAGGLGAVGLLAACGGGGDDAAAENSVRWGNWPLYLDFDEDSKTYPTLEKFKTQTGIDAQYFEDYNDNDEFFGKVQAQLKLGEDIGYDLVTPTDWMAARWIRLGYAQKYDLANIPNHVNILDSLKSPSYDPMRESTLTWQGIMAGFGWNTEKNPKGVRTIEDLFSPQNKGKIVVLTEMRDTIGVILLSQGVDITKVTEDQFMNAVDFMAKKIADGWIRGVKGNEYAEDLTSGDATAVIGWSGDMFILASENEGKFDFAIPESGGTISGDNLMIPSTASPTGKVNAEKLINYYYDPVVAAEVAAYVNYVCPVKGAQAEMEKIAPELATSEYIFPTQKTSSRLNVFRSLTPDEETKWAEAFQQAQGN